jgi:hypothetical protein
MMQWKDTMNSMIHRLGVMNNLPVTIDEITKLSGDHFSDLAYSISQGRGKNRMKQHENAERSNTTKWGTMALCSSNASFYDKLSSLKATPDGEFMRLLEYRIDLTGALTKEEADIIFNRLYDNYGHAGVEYAQYLVGNLETALDAVLQIQQKLDKAIGLTSRERFWSAIIACNIAGALIAKDLGIINFDIKRVFDWIVAEVKVMRNDIKAPTATHTARVINEFMKEASLNALWDGISFILVDMPKNEIEIVNFQQQVALGVTPYFSHVRASQILNRRIENQTLVQITLDENVTEYEGAFGEKTINQQRVLFIGGGRIYRNDAVVYEWTNNLNYIPLIPVYSNKTTYLNGAPKFLPMAQLNFKHYNIGSQLDKALFVSANPIPVIFGDVNEEQGGQVVIGVDMALKFRDRTEGGFEWVEFAGTSIDKLQEEIKNVETRMASIGLAMLTNAKGDKTATEASIVATSETSDLSSIASSIEWSINEAYRVWCEMMGQSPSGELTVNKDFVGALTPDEARVYLDMFNSGVLDIDTLWTELQRREFVQEFDRDLAKAQIEAKNQVIG